MSLVSVYVTGAIIYSIAESGIDLIQQPLIEEQMQTIMCMIFTYFKESLNMITQPQLQLHFYKVSYGLVDQPGSAML